MNTRKIRLAVTMALFALPIGSVLWAEENEAPEPLYTDYKIDEVTCRDMLMMGGTSRDFTMAFMHGFMSGKKSELLFQVEPLTEATDMVLKTCIDHPDETLLAAFEKARK